MSLAIRFVLFVLLTSGSVVLYALPYLTISEPQAEVAAIDPIGPA
jgi:hypothetical protein